MVAALLLLVMLWSLIFVTIWVTSNQLSGMLVDLWEIDSGQVNMCQQIQMPTGVRESTCKMAMLNVVTGVYCKIL